MKRLLILILTICAVVTAMHAQRITRNFQNVSMSDALKYIQQQTGNHKIVFIYNELEDFTITTNVKNKPVPDGIDKHYDNLTYINRGVIEICCIFAATTHTFN